MSGDARWPVPFARRSMAACAFGGRMLCFGGVGVRGTESILDVSDELWLFDPAAGWSRIPRTEPWPSARRCIGWTVHACRILMWGGSGVDVRADGASRHTFLNDEWLLDPVGLTWTCDFVGQDHRRSPSGDSRPAPRYTPVVHSVGGSLVLFGGYTEDRLGKRKLSDLWIDDGMEWREVDCRDAAAAGNWPGERYGCMSAADGEGVIIVGGFCDLGDHIDVWRLDVPSRRWERLSGDGGPGMPAPRYCAAMTVHDGRLVMFGGRSRRHPKLNFNDLWVFDLGERRWHEVLPCRAPHQYGADAPFPGYHAKASTAAIGSHWYVWGGEGLHGHVSDMWRLDLGALRWELVHGSRDDDPRFW